MTPVLDLAAGGRPNFITLAPVVQAIVANDAVDYRIVYTGQHYDYLMADVFFKVLDIPAPDVHLGVGSGSHDVQTARILERYEAHLAERRPAATVVYGGVNSIVACALAAVKLGITVAHVEAGLRRFDRTMPEEINRVLTYAISDLLLVSEPSGVANLRREGVAESKIRLVGNVVIYSLLALLPVARERNTTLGLGLKEGEYCFVTLHRPSNVGDPRTVARLLELLHELAAELPVVFPVHPRTLHADKRAGMAGRLAPGQLRLTCLPPSPTSTRCR